VQRIIGGEQVPSGRKTRRDRFDLSVVTPSSMNWFTVKYLYRLNSIMALCLLGVRFKNAGCFCVVIINQSRFETGYQALVFWGLVEAPSQVIPRLVLQVH